MENSFSKDQISEKTFHKEDISFNTNDQKEADRLDKQISAKSEEAYNDIAKEIVRVTKYELNQQSNSKNALKSSFSTFFKWFIGIQYFVLTTVIFFKALMPSFSLSETIIITYMTSVFVETLSAIIIMIKYAFNSDEEVQLISILNSAISSYQKFNGNTNK